MVHLSEAITLLKVVLGSRYWQFITSEREAVLSIYIASLIQTYTSVLSTEARPDPGSESNSNQGGSNENQTVSLREPPSTTRYPTLPSSVTMPDFPVDQKGDPLIQLSDTEWEHGVQAFPNEFINLTREEDRVSVFAAPEKAAEYQAKLEEQRRRRRLARHQRRMEEAMEKGFRPLETFPELVDAVTRTLNEDRVQNHGVQVHVIVKVIKANGSQFSATTITAD